MREMWNKIVKAFGQAIAWAKKPANWLRLVFTISWLVVVGGCVAAMAFAAIGEFTLVGRAMAIVALNVAAWLGYAISNCALDAIKKKGLYHPSFFVQSAVILAGVIGTSYPWATLSAGGGNPATYAGWALLSLLAGLAVAGFLGWLGEINWRRKWDNVVDWMADTYIGVTKFLRRAAEFFRNRPWIYGLVIIITIPMMVVGLTALNDPSVVGDANTNNWQLLVGVSGVLIAVLCTTILVGEYNRTLKYVTEHWDSALELARRSQKHQLEAEEQAEKAKQDYEAFGEDVAKTRIMASRVPAIVAAWNAAMTKTTLEAALGTFFGPLTIGEFIKLDGSFAKTWRAVHADREIRLDQMTSDQRIWNLVRVVAWRYNFLVREGPGRHFAAMDAPNAFLLGLDWMSHEEMTDLRDTWRRILAAALPERIEINPPEIRLVGTGIPKADMDPLIQTLVSHE